MNMCMHIRTSAGRRLTACVTALVLLSALVVPARAGAAGVGAVVVGAVGVEGASIIVDPGAAARASLVVDGRVVSESVTITVHGEMHLVTEIEVEADVSGDAPAAASRGERSEPMLPRSRLLVETPGGESPEGLVHRVSHQPLFSAGDVVQLALLPAPISEAAVLADAWPVAGLEVFSVVDGDHGAAWYSSAAEGALAGSGLGAAGGEVAAVAQDESYTLTGRKWASFVPRPTYLINPSGAPAGIEAIIDAAVQSWAQVPGVDVGLVFGGSTTLSGLSPDSVNVISWVNTLNPADGFLAQTNTYWISTDPTTIIGFDIQFNRDFAFVNGAQPGAWDIQTVAVHEVGHALGLSHVASTAQLMYDTIEPGRMNRALGLGDIRGLQAMYATSPIPPTATPLPTMTPLATATPLPTVAPTATPLPTVAPTATPLATAAPTVTPLPTATRAPASTLSPAPTATSAPTPTSTATPTATATPDSASITTVTPRPSATATPEATATARPTPAEIVVSGDDGLADFPDFGSGPQVGIDSERTRASRAAAPVEQRAVTRIEGVRDVAAVVVRGSRTLDDDATTITPEMRRRAFLMAARVAQDLEPILRRMSR